jgi:CxxC-x17-CxxC domain-containing protein
MHAVHFVIKSVEGERMQGRFHAGPRRFHDGPREMHKAVCSECKKECEVPFKPAEGRDVFCKDCYAKRNPRRF